MEIPHRFWLGDREGFDHGSAGGHRSMPVHGRARRAAVRDPKVRLRGLSEIATNAPHAFLLQCTCLQLALSKHQNALSRCPLSGVKRTSKFKRVMSAFDPKRTSAKVASMSAADQKADSRRAASHGQAAPRNLVAIAGR
jgi:hypothetical protein